MAYEPVFSPFEKRPITQNLKNITNLRLALLRDHFSILTWIVIGGVLQGLLALRYRHIAIVAPGLAFLAFKLIKTMLQTFGILRNPYMDDIVPGRAVPVFPNEKGVQEDPAQQQICIMLLGARSNHPMGIFNLPFKGVADRFEGLIRDLDADPTKHGFLGSSTYLEAGGRGTSSEIVSIFYFENVEKVHEFAHGPLHNEAMQWYMKIIPKSPWVSVRHEIFSAPKDGFEGVYTNYNLTGMGSTTKEMMIDGKPVWMSPLVHGTGKLSYSKGRMGRPFSEKTEWPEWEVTGREV